MFKFLHAATPRWRVVALLSCAGFGAVGYTLYTLGHHRGSSVATAAAPAEATNNIAAGEAATRRHITQGLKAGQTDPANGRPILFYQDPMVPGQRFDAPAKSPFMDMMLVPVYGGGGGDAGVDRSTVTISPRVQQSLGVRTAEVIEGTLQVVTSAAGQMLEARPAGGARWAQVDLPESEAPRVAIGASAELRVLAQPRSVFRGTVRAVSAEVDPVTRTRRAMVEMVDSADAGAGSPAGLWVSARLASPRAQKALLIPSEALIETGRRSVVILAEGDGHFAPVEVVAGVESAGQTEILRGLKAGQRVVVSSQFLIDSEASLKGVETRLVDAAPATGAKP